MIKNREGLGRATCNLILGVIIGLMFIFLPIITRLLSSDMHRKVGVVLSFENWCTFIPYFIIIFLIGAIRNMAQLSISNEVNRMIVIIVCNIIQLILFTYLIVVLPFFNNESLLLIVKGNQKAMYFIKWIPALAMLLIFTMDIIGEVLKIKSKV